MADEQNATPIIEIAQALKAVRGVLPTSEFERVRDILVQGRHVDAGRALAGLNEEDEFAVLCRLMCTTTHLVPLGQRLLLRGDYIVPDFLARFQPGCSFRGWTQADNDGFSCLIEVKSTKKNHFHVGGLLLQRLRRFADTFGLPLLFAVRFVRFRESALWVIVEDQDRSKRSLKIKLNDLISGARRALWDEYLYMIAPGTYFQASYTREATGSNVVRPGYGEQFAFQVATTDGRLTFHGADSVLFSAFFEAFNPKEVEKRVSGDITDVIYVPTLAFCSIADLIYRMNRLPQDEKGCSTYDAAKLLMLFQSEDEPAVVTRSHIEAIGGHLLSKKVLFVLGFGDEESHVALWRRYGGKSHSEQAANASQ